MNVKKLRGTGHITNNHKHSRQKTAYLLNLSGTASKWMAPEMILGIFYQLNKSDEQSPWVRTLGDETLQQNPSDLLLNTFILCFIKQVKHYT